MGVCSRTCERCRENVHEDDIHDYVFYRDSDVKEAQRLARKFKRQWIEVLIKHFNEASFTYCDNCADKCSIESIKQNDKIDEMDCDQHYRIAKDDQEFDYISISSKTIQDMTYLKLREIEDILSYQKKKSSI